MSGERFDYSLDELLDTINRRDGIEQVLRGGDVHLYWEGQEVGVIKQRPPPKPAVAEREVILMLDDLCSSAIRGEVKITSYRAEAVDARSSRYTIEVRRG